MIHKIRSLPSLSKHKAPFFTGLLERWNSYSCCCILDREPQTQCPRRNAGL